MNRRQFFGSIAGLGITGLAFAGYKFWPENGFTNPCLSGLPNSLKQHTLMQEIWSGLDVNQVWDSHLHITGVGDNSSSGIWFNPLMDSYFHPILKVQKHYYMNGSCTEKRKC